MEFTHIEKNGLPKMVNVSDKNETLRVAKAFGRVFVNKETFELIKNDGTKKGDVISTAKIAGIMACKKTSDLIPLCHPIFVEGIDLDFVLNEKDLSVDISSCVTMHGQTGVEMESLTAVSVACLTIYDMCKAVQRDIVISDIKLLEKSGGVHGDYSREQ